MMWRARWAMAENARPTVGENPRDRSASERLGLPEASGSVGSLPPDASNLGAVRIETVGILVVAGAVVYFLLHALVSVLSGFTEVSQAVGS
jgi:hypothetical protein